MKKRIILVFIMMVLLALMGCKKEGSSEKLRIGVAVAFFDDQFFVSLIDSMKNFAEENYGDEVELTFVDGKNDPARQLDQIENFITQGMDKIIVVPVDSQSSDAMSKLAIEAGTDIIYCNRPPQAFYDGVYLVGSNQKISGVMEMEALAEKAGYKGNVAVLMGELGQEAQVLRTEGFEEVVAKYPDMKIIKKQTAKWSRPLGLDVMENWISSGDKIDIVASNNDEMAIGAISAIESAGKLNDIIVGGVDGTADALNSVATGKLDVTVFQDSPGQASGSVEVAYKLWKGEPVEQITDIPFQLITQKNYKEFMK